MTNFDKTRTALKEYFDHNATFDTSPDEYLLLWFDKHDRLELECGKAYVEATKEINGKLKAHHVSAWDIAQHIGYIHE